MTNYHPDVQRAYESHCADGYVVPDDETGPQEATGATESDETRVQAHGDGTGLREAVSIPLGTAEISTQTPQPGEVPHMTFLGPDYPGLLDETLDDLTRTLARAEKAEAALREVAAKVRREMKNYYTSTQNEGFEVALNIIDRALSDTTGDEPERKCSRCGKGISDRACGPTHARLYQQQKSRAGEASR